MHDLMMPVEHGFPDDSVGKKSVCNAGDTGGAGLIPGLGRCPGEGNGNPFHYSCLGNPMDRGAWQATAHKVARVGCDLVTKQQQPRVNQATKNKKPHYFLALANTYGSSTSTIADF